MAFAFRLLQLTNEQTAKACIWIFKLASRQLGLAYAATAYTGEVRRLLQMTENIVVIFSYSRRK